MSLFKSISNWWDRFQGRVKSDERKADTPGGYQHPDRGARGRKTTPHAKRHRLWAWFGGAAVYANGTSKVFPGYLRKMK